MGAPIRMDTPSAIDMVLWATKGGTLGSAKNGRPENDLRGEPATPRRAADDHDPSSTRCSPLPALEGAACLLAVPPRKRRRPAPPCGPGAPAAGTAAHRPASNGAPGAIGRSGASNGSGRGPPALPRLPSGGANGAPGQGAGGAGAGGSGSDDGDDAGGDGEELRAMDTQCTWCDNSGFLLECDGACRRTFHIGIEPEEEEDEEEEAGAGDGGAATPGRPPTQSGPRRQRFRAIDDACNPLDIPPDLAELLVTTSEDFKCPGCLGSEQQCFACHVQSPVEEGDDPVRRCKVTGCGRFYHPVCMKKAWRELGKGPAWLKLGVCPLHVCHVCKVMTSAQGPSDDLVGCRRCPTAYHIGCMPHALLFAAPTRLWVAVLDEHGDLMAGCDVETSLIYCQRHALDADGVAPQESQLFTDDLVAAFRAHWARKYPHLGSSKKLLETLPPEEGEEEEEEEEEGAGAAPAAAAAADGGPLSLAAVRRLDRDRAAKRARYLLAEARSRVGKDQVQAETRQPVPYTARAKKAVEEGRLREMERSVAGANAQLAGDRTGDTLRMLLPRAAVAEVGRRHDDLMAMLAPYMHGDRYTSYGRHFSLPALLRRVVGVLAPLLRPGDQVVDFSCGKNEWVPLVKAAALADGIAVTGRAYDIIVARNLTDFVLKSWFDVAPGAGELERPNRLVVGLNPPFGKNNALAAAFVNHAAKFKPRLIVLIVPPATPVPPDYVTVFEDRAACRGEIFYVPGSAHASWNKETPALRVLVREDVAGEVLDATPRGGGALAGGWEEVPVPRRGRGR